MTGGGVWLLRCGNKHCPTKTARARLRKKEFFLSVHTTLFRSVGSHRGSTKFRKSETPNFCENFIKEKLLIFIKESTFVNVAKPRNGLFGHKNGSKYGFLGKFGQKPIL